MLIGHIRTSMPSDAQYIETLEVHFDGTIVKISLKESVPSGGMDGSRSSLSWIEVAGTSIDSSAFNVGVLAHHIVGIIKRMIARSAPIIKKDGRPSKSFTWVGEEEMVGLSTANCLKALQFAREIG